MTKEENTPFARIIKDCSEAGIPFPQKLVSQFERVAIKLSEDWGRLAAADYLQDLIFPSRPGRGGFPAEIVEEILALKNLHDERYANVLKPDKGPFSQAYIAPTQGKDNQNKGDVSASPHKEVLPEKRSIYRTRSATSPRAGLNRSKRVTLLLPQSVRDQLARIIASRTATGPTTRVPAPAAKSDEILLDAERLLEEEHLNSGTALLELMVTVYPKYSPYAYVRLMEIYYRLRRREDYDRVCQQMSEQYDCGKIEFDATEEVFVTKLDEIAQKFLLA